MIGENLGAGKHTLHLKIAGQIEDATSNHFFQLLNVLKAEKNN
jgi:hypothetical protein